MEFAAEIGDVHVDGARDEPARVQVPDLLEDFVARDGAVRVRREITEQICFATGQFIALAVVMPDFRPLQIRHSAGEFDQAHGIAFSHR